MTTSTTQAQPERGLIFHWGLYAVSGFDSPQSASSRRICNGSEWYLKRLLESDSYRPTSGWRETQAYHKKHFPPGTTYWDFAKSFAPDPVATVKAIRQDWMRAAKQFGATYVILTAKHHDGCCLWPTKTVSNGARAATHDWVREFKQAGTDAGLRFGLYFSWMEFERKPTKEFFEQIVRPQMKELMAYAPEIYWFDGDWLCRTQHARQAIADICAAIRFKFPRAQINDRLADPKLDDPWSLGTSGATYRVYADRAFPPSTVTPAPVTAHVPGASNTQDARSTGAALGDAAKANSSGKETKSVPKTRKQPRWEHINTIGLSWGYNRAQEAKHYKTRTQLSELSKRVRTHPSKCGRFLLNLGPDADGKLDPRELTALSELASIEQGGKLDSHELVTLSKLASIEQGATVHLTTSQGDVPCAPTMSSLTDAAEIAGPSAATTTDSTLRS